MINKKRLAIAVLSLVMTAQAAGCGSVSSDAPLISINDGEETSISYGYANMVAKYEQAQYDQIYVSYFGSSVWGEDVGNGLTFEEDVKEDILDDLEEEYLAVAHASEYGIELSDEDEAAIAEAVSEFLAVNTDEAIEQMGATSDLLTEYLRRQTILARVKEAVRAEAEVTETAAEEADADDDDLSGDDSSGESTEDESTTGDEGTEDEAMTEDEQRDAYYELALAAWKSEITWTVDEELWSRVTFDELFEMTESDAAGTGSAD